MFFCLYNDIKHMVKGNEPRHEKTSSRVSDQVRLKLACSATVASMRLEILVKETRNITLSRQRTTKTLIISRGCAGWFAPLLFTYDIRQVFSWPGSNNVAEYVLGDTGLYSSFWCFCLLMIHAVYFNNNMSQVAEIFSVVACHIQGEHA